MLQQITHGAIHVDKKKNIVQFFWFLIFLFMTNYTTMQKLFVTLNVINNPMRLRDAKLYVWTHFQINSIFCGYWEVSFFTY